MVEFEAGQAAELGAQLGLWQGVASASSVSEAEVQQFVLPLLDRVAVFAERHELYALRTIRAHTDALRSGPHSLQMALQESSAIFSRSLDDSRVWRATLREKDIYDNPGFAW